MTFSYTGLIEKVCRPALQIAPIVFLCLSATLVPVEGMAQGTWYVRLSGGDWNTTLNRPWGTAGDIPLANTDFDEDGKADMAVWRPSNGTWYVRLSAGDWNTTLERQWGTVGDMPLANTDFDGDGKADMAVWRPSNGTWYVRLSGGDWNTTLERQWGTDGDIPLASTDFDKDGKADMALWRPSNGTWYVRLSAGDWNTTLERQWGTGGDIPLASTDFDEDGKADMAVWRPSNGTWYVRLSGGDWNTTLERQWGTDGDMPLATTDFDEDGKADMAVWRPSNGTWYVRLSGGDWNTTLERQWGTGGDMPLANTDFDEDGKADMAVWRPSNGTWYVRLSGGDWNTTLERQWGTDGDMPLASTDFDEDGKADMAVWRPAEIGQVEIWINELTSAVLPVDNPTDDYLTWSPTYALARLATPGASDETVVLTNDSAAQGGEIRFAAFADPWPVDTTATQSSLVLTLPGDGSWVPFVVAGAFGSPSIDDKDAVVEAHQGTDAGPILGTKAMMVRIRKDANTLAPSERDRFLLAWQAFRNQGGTMNYIVAQEMHRLASTAGDEAHMQPAFLTWHRAFLLSVERELQKIDPSVALHYWNWDAAAPNVFHEDFMGAPGTPAFPGAIIAEPKFSITNPLIGWDTNLPFSAGELQRNVNDHTLDPGGAMKPLDDPVDDSLVDWTDYGPTTPFAVNSFSDDVEKASHNPAHGWPCGSGHLTNPNRSAADPLFYLLHSQIDQEWAYWQKRHNRFGNLGGASPSFPAPQHYDNSGAFDSPGNVADADFRQKGAFLEDGLWPWDGTTGGTPMTAAWRPNNQASAPGTNVPISMPLIPSTPFPASAHANLWPATATVPLNRDVIDFPGKFRPNNGLGFSYDNVPY